MKLKLIGTYIDANYELYKEGVLDGLLFAMHTKSDLSIVRDVKRLRQKHPDILIYLDNGAFPLLQGASPSHNIQKRYKDFNIVDHIERYIQLTKLIQPHWAPIPLDFIMVDKWGYTKDEIETNYRYTMEMNKRYSPLGFAPVLQISSYIPMDRYLSDLKECKMEKCCIGGVATSLAVMDVVSRYVKAVKNAFPNVKIHVFGRGPSWFVPLDILGVYSVDTNSLVEWGWMRYKNEILKEKPHLARIPVGKLKMLVIKDVADRLKLLKANSHADHTNAVVSPS